MLPRFCAALAIAWVGGAIFAYFQLPLAWMLGAMTACTIAAILGAPIGAPAIIRAPMTAIIGVLLGSAFTPAIIGQIVEWPISLAAMLVFVLISGAVMTAYFYFVGKFDLPTAYFGAMPGGLVEMILVGEQKGGDPRYIALIHSARILLVVLTLPLIVQWLAGAPIGSGTRTSVPFDDFVITSLWLVTTAVAGVALGFLLRLPARFLLGPMLVSAAIHMTEISDFRTPTIIVNTAQLVLGTVIGCRFVGTPSAVILRILGLSTGATIILLMLTLGFSIGVAKMTSLEQDALLLAFSPGGLPEMSLMAFALEIEVGFVAAHHILRVVWVLLIANVLFPLLGRKNKLT